MVSEHSLVQFSAEQNDACNRRLGVFHVLNFVVINTDCKELIVIFCDNFVIVSDEKVKVNHSDWFQIL